MKPRQLIILGFCILSSTVVLCQQPDTSLQEGIRFHQSFSGMWLREMDSMVLYIEDYTIDSFAFVMVSYLSNYFGFLGESDSGFFKYARIDENTAYFDDTGAYVDGRPLYYEGEEPCELFFTLKDKEHIDIMEKNTCGVYSGRTYWKGNYSRFHDAEILQDILESSKLEY